MHRAAPFVLKLIKPKRSLPEGYFFGHFYLITVEVIIIYMTTFRDKSLHPK